MDGPDDEDDGPAFPVAVRAAGVLWAVQGGVVILAGVGVALYRVWNGWGDAVLIAMLAVGVGGAVAWGGVTVARGRVLSLRDVVAVGAVGWASVGVGIGTVAEARDVPGGSVLAVTTGVAFALPGLLLLTGAREYDAWRARRRGG